MGVKKNAKIILTGIQCTGIPHLGNLLGVILPSISLINSNNESLFFIADLHSLTHIKNPIKLRTYTYQVASVLLACGLDSTRVSLYRQSDVSEVTELGWYLNCFYSYPRLKLAHSFKDKSSYLEDINTGLFTYPILMAADILLYNANIIPLGRDQLQHIEISRDIAKRYNRKMGNFFLFPKPIVSDYYIPGVDGKKMSKSKGNIIDIFISDIELYKQIITIKTNSSLLEETKNPYKDMVLYIYKLLASKKMGYKMQDSYLAYNYGYLDAKRSLYYIIIDNFSKEREKFIFFRHNPSIINEILLKGSIKAAKIAKKYLNFIRKGLGLLSFREMAEGFKAHVWKTCI